MDACNIHGMRVNRGTQHCCGFSINCCLPCNVKPCRWFYLLLYGYQILNGNMQWPRPFSIYNIYIYMQARAWSMCVFKSFYSILSHSDTFSIYAWCHIIVCKYLRIRLCSYMFNKAPITYSLIKCYAPNKYYALNYHVRLTTL